MGSERTTTPVWVWALSAALAVLQPVSVYWISSTGARPYLDNYCRAVCDAMDNFSYHAILQTAHDALPAALYAAQDLATPQFYLAAPRQLAERAAAQLLQHGAREAALMVDYL